MVPPPLPRPGRSAAIYAHSAQQPPSQTSPNALYCPPPASSSQPCPFPPAPSPRSLLPSNQSFPLPSPLLLPPSTFPLPQPQSPAACCGLLPYLRWNCREAPLGSSAALIKDAASVRKMVRTLRCAPEATGGHGQKVEKLDKPKKQSTW